MSDQTQLWRDRMPDAPIASCGRLDMSTELDPPAIAGRVESARVRYVYFEDGSECIVVGKFCDFVAFRAADYDERLAAQATEIERLRDLVRLAWIEGCRSGWGAGLGKPEPQWEHSDALAALGGGGGE